MRRDLERDLREIISGQRLAADMREVEADVLLFQGDEAGAERLRASAAHCRRMADAAVRGLAKLARSRWDSAAYKAQTALVQRLSAVDWEAQRQAQAERRQLAQERVAARRKTRAA